MDMTKVGGDFKVCPCRGKTKDQLMDEIRENGIRDLKTLRDVLNAGNKCGACSEDLESLIQMVWKA